LTNSDKYETVFFDSKRVYFGSSPGPSLDCPECKGVLIDSNSTIFDGKFFSGKFVEGACMKETRDEDEWLFIKFDQSRAKSIRKMKLDKELGNKLAKEFNYEHAQG
jgi:hypothetical protein